MCFLALLHKMVDDFPLVVAANRDEFLDRPGTAPFEIRPGIVAGQDPRSGGTWLGVNRRGMIVAVTNRYGQTGEWGQAAISDNPYGRTEIGTSSHFRSRGLLCLDLLELAGTAEIERALGDQLLRHAYNEFNLIVADRQTAWAVTQAGGKLNVTPLAPGLHIVANTLPDNGADPKIARGMALFGKSGTDANWRESSPVRQVQPDQRANSAKDDLAAPIRLSPRFSIDAVIGALKEICADHGTSPDDAICVHAPGRGTLSSAIIAMHNSDPAQHRYLYADGSPCTAAYQDISRLLTNPVERAT